MNYKIKEFIAEINSDSLAAERTETLQPLIDYIQSKINKKAPIRLNFICTHNSRRSHLSQIWAQTMACYFKIPNINCYSGGTQATALFPKVAEILVIQGFDIQKLSSGTNPVYSIKFSENEASIIGFSKTFDDDFNPKNNFCAIMTCSDADQGCPFISGAEKRIPVRYDDPKVFDNSEIQNQKYLECSIQIASEMFFVFSKIDYER